MNSLFSIYIFKDYALLALSNRNFENIIYEYKTSMSEFYEIMQSDKPVHIEYNNRLYILYVPVMHNSDDFGPKIIEIK